MSESRASDYPQPHAIRKSAHIRGTRQGFIMPGPYVPGFPTGSIPAKNLSYMVTHGARTYDPLQARQIVNVHEAPLVYPMTYAAQRMIGHGARPDYDRGSWTKIMIIHSAVV